MMKQRYEIFSKPKKKGITYAYFALKGDNFDPQVVTDRIGIAATESWRRGDNGLYKPTLEYSCWKLCTDKEKDSLDIYTLIDEIVGKLFDRVEVIKDIKRQFGLASLLEVVMYIDTNEEQSAPSLGYDQKAIDFLYRTQTTTDVDIYRYNSSGNEI